MSRKVILVAEDDANILRGLVDTFESEDYEVRSARTGTDALALLARGAVDLVILDIMMPGKSGYDVCREIRKKDEKTPIIMLTAKSEEVDKVVGLELGADDYVTKPFGVRELLARVNAVLRRSQRPVADASEEGAEAVFRFGAAEVDRKRFVARVGKREHSLSARELKLIDHFRAHEGEVLSRDDLLNAAWGVDYLGTTRTLDQHIAQLRKKVESNPADPKTILTVHGIGYRYVA
jgi:DNA-binding response OmpR family regulator